MNGIKKKPSIPNYRGYDSIQETLRMPPRTHGADIFSKRAGSKITHRNQCFCQIATRNTLKKETKGIIPFTKIKYLEINVTKYEKELYDGNFKSLKKEIEQGTKRWNAFPCSLIKLLLRKGTPY